MSAHLDSCQARLLVNVDQLVHPAKIKRDDRPGLALRGAQATGETGAPTVMITASADGAIDNEPHIRLIARIGHDIGRARDIAGGDPQQIRGALPYVCTIRSRSWASDWV